MRPLKLSFSGIRSYPGTVGPLDFTGKTLIGIVGDTGAGKSTILEAITLALYGSCTWTDRENKALIAQGAAHMAVDFTFAHDGQQWRVRRGYHANTTQPSHLLENLGTGEQTDGKRAVDSKIESILQLSFDSFATAVLLPQGKFDRLLTATGRERTGLLKSIFGVQVVEVVRDRADVHRRELLGLVHQADLARLRLLDDPAASAAREAAQAAEADLVAEELGRALGTLRRHRSDAVAAREGHAAVAAALTALRRHERTDTAAALAKITEADTRLTVDETAAAESVRQWAGRRADAEGKLRVAAHDGFTGETLASAATLLGALPTRLDALAAGQAQLDADADALSGEAAQLKADQAALSGLQATADSLALVRVGTATTLEEYRTARGRLEDAVRTVLQRAADTGKAQRQEEAAQDREADLAGSVTALQAEAEAAAAELRTADDHLGHIRSLDAAHTASQGLSAGDQCRICSRPLPDGYQPPASIDPAALGAADLAERKARKTERKSAERLADARGQAVGARDASATCHTAVRAALGRLKEARQAAAAEQPTAQAGQSGWPGNPAFDQVLEAACSRLARGCEGEPDDVVPALLAGLLDLSAAAERELGTAAARAADEADSAKARADLKAASVSLRLEHHEQTTRALAAARRRHAETVAGSVRELTALPAQLRDLLPNELADITPDRVRQAVQAVTRHQDEVAALIRQRDEAVDKVGEASAALQQLVRTRQEEVTGRLHALVTHLQRLHDAVERAANVLSGSPVTVPVRPAAFTVAEVTHYAAALAEADETAIASLSGEVEAAADEAAARLKRLSNAAARLAAGTDSLPAIALPAGDALLEPSSLDAVVSAETTARDAAARHRADQHTAEGQVERAAALDAALGDGRSRLSAADALHGLLADAKFLKYLTDRRTRALLAVASETFGTLSGGEFGFSADFQVVSRRTEAARSPKTLSGGETFLASLALALALVELHSRSGARLGALFLDEGFASLDVDSLAGALAVLQAETGGDKLVAVVSHLHAVAEAVPDVLWVERGPEGSAARWLTPDQRDALVRQEVTGGLLDLL
jgi:exonuclease SbcC